MLLRLSFLLFILYTAITCNDTPLRPQIKFPDNITLNGFMEEKKIYDYLCRLIKFIDYFTENIMEVIKKRKW